jgi:collagenase-like PrtC family protease
MHFNYLLNGACTDNLECTRSGQRSVQDLLDWLVDIGVERVTVASPHLLRMVKERCSWLHVRISVFAGVDHVRKARMWEDMGADRIALDSLLVNREFDLLAAIRRSVSCDLELLVNNSCLQSCSMSPHHMNTLAHASQSGHRARAGFVDWCFLRCTRMRLEDPIHYIRADWIRPEDLHRYEALGYSSFKLVERAAPTGVLVARVRAYSARRWDGNLLDLVQPYGFPRSLAGSAPRHRGLLWLLRYFLRPSLSNTRRTLKLRRLAQNMSMLDARDGEPPVFVDNRLLDGFMDRFEQRGCRDTDCDTCGYCAKWARRAVRMNPAFRNQTLQLHKELLHDLEAR